jgi:protease-4
MMKLMQRMFGGQPREKVSDKQKIAVVYAVGIILPGKSTTSLFGQEVLGAATMVKALRAADEDPKVAAIVLRIDSPGGSALASDLIWREVVRIKKPIIASMGDVAGSGGYYVAMGADRILAAPDTITGSIGVVGGKFVLGGLYDKIGITTEVISRGKNSGAFSSTQPFSPGEREAWMAVMKDVYDQFVTKAAQGRKMPRDKLEALAQGRVYSGRMAAANGLIDALGTLEDAIAEAKKAAGLPADQDVDLLILPRPRTIFEELFEDSWLWTPLEAAAPELIETLPDVQVARRLFSEPALALMPCRLELK